jgi:hypothetical protein
VIRHVPPLLRDTHLELRAEGYVIETLEQHDEYGFALHRLVSEFGSAAMDAGGHHIGCRRATTLGDPTAWLGMRLDVQTMLSKKFGDRDRRPM